MMNAKCLCETKYIKEELLKTGWGNEETIYLLTAANWTVCHRWIYKYRRDQTYSIII